MNEPDCPHVPVSWGELLDKITILEIKKERIGSAAARANVAKELRLLETVAAPVLRDQRLHPLQTRLKAINQTLWEIEDAIRVKEREGDFSQDFIALSRSVYKRNDERAAVKREINFLLGSALVEEKSYAHDRSAFFASPGAKGRAAAPA